MTNRPMPILHGLLRSVAIWATIRSMHIRTDVTREWLTTAQAVALLGDAFSSWTLRKAAIDGRVPHSFTPGGHMRFRTTDVLALQSRLMRSVPRISA